MNYIEIDKLKNIFSDLQKRQITLKSAKYGIEGKIIAIGYNPYWTNKYDSKIAKLELSFLGKNGVLVPLELKNIIDYNPMPKENRMSKKYKMEKLELIILSPDINQYLSPRKQADVSETVVFDIVYDD